MKTELTPAERQRAIDLDRLLSGDFSTPRTQANAIAHHEAFKRFVTARPNGGLSTIPVYRHSPWD